MEQPAKDPIPLEYSSPIDETRRERQFEDERAQAIGDYNESTFGERKPFSLIPFFVVLIPFLILAIWLPRWLAILGAAILGRFHDRIYFSISNWLK